MYHTKPDVHTKGKGAKAPAASKMSLIAQHQKRTSSPEDVLARASFSSIRERDADLAQTFSSSKVSSYSRNLQNELQRCINDGSNETAVSDEHSAPSTPLSRPGTPRVSFSVEDVLVAQGKHFATQFDLSVVLDDITRQGDVSALEAGSFANVVDADTAMEDVDSVEPTQRLQPLEKLPYEVYRKYILAHSLTL